MSVYDVGLRHEPSLCTLIAGRNRKSHCCVWTFVLPVGSLSASAARSACDWLAVEEKPHVAHQHCQTDTTPKATCGGVVWKKRKRASQCSGTSFPARFRIHPPLLWEPCQILRFQFELQASFRESYEYLYPGKTLPIKADLWSITMNYYSRLWQPAVTD